MSSPFTPDDFPLSDNLDYQQEPEFDVLVPWSDPEESPSAAVERLIEEVIEQSERARDAEAVVAVLRNNSPYREFIIQPPGPNGMRKVVHSPCGTTVHTIATYDYPLAEVLNSVNIHDCSIAGLVTVKTRGNVGLRTMVDSMRSLCEGVGENVEYVRGVAETLCETLGIDMDRKDEAAIWLTSER